MRQRSWVPYVALAATDALLAGVAGAGATAASNARRLRRATKPLLMPTLALTASPLPPLATAGLCLSTAGDIALLSRSETAFSVGLGSFLLAHGSYIAAFGSAGGITGLRRHPWKMAPALVLSTWSAAWLAPKAGQMRWPVTGYGMIIGAMQAVAAGTNRPALTWGAATFCLSDLILATDKFTRTTASKRFSIRQAAVMATYTAGQAMIISGLADSKR